jgi:hypothetical protein
MDIEKIKKKILDSSAREMYHELKAKFLKRKPAAVFGANAPAVFVLSTGRTGTETLDALFGLAKNVFTHHEPTPTLYRLSRLAYEYEKEQLANEILREAFLTARADLLKYSLDCGRGYVETSPQVTFLAPLILSAIPQSRFIHLVRDPRHVVRSGMRRKWFDGHAGDATRIVPHPNSPDGRKWDEYTAFQKNLWLWAETNRWILEFAAGLPAESILRIHSEDVFNRDETALYSLFKFVNAPLPARAKISRLLNKKLNAQKSGSFPAPGGWSAGQKEDLLKIAGDVAQTLGYDLSKDDE